MSNSQKINILAPELEFLKLVQKACFEKYAYIISFLNLQLCLEMGSVILTFETELAKSSEKKNSGRNDKIGLRYGIF